MPPKGKRGNLPNQHDKRHEGGLAAPGKRVSRQRSGGNLNGLANGKPSQSLAPPPLPSSGLNQGFTFSHPKQPAAAAAAAAATADPIAQDTVKEYDTDAVARHRTGSDTSMGDLDPYGGMAEGTCEATQHEPSAVNNTHNNTTTTTSSSSSSTSPQQPCVPALSNTSGGSADQSANKVAAGLLAATSMLVPFRPLYDAIAILTLLLILPTAVVNFFQAVFASLMFGPSSSAASLSSMPKLKDMLNASNLGNPALFTVAVVDLIFYLGFLMVWKPLQDVLLDLSQVFMAISLSGAAATDQGPTYSIATCSLVVCVVHVLRYKAIHLTALDYLRSVIHKLDIPMDINSFAVSSSSSPFASTHSSQYGWLEAFLRGALGIHIVATGVTNIVRSSLAKANERNQNLPAITRSDPEATAGSEQPVRPGSAHPDAAQTQSPATAGDGRNVGSQSGHRESKTRESSTKRKRRQAIRLQTQQPLWAAFASTKVTFAKESEKREAANDGKEAVSRDTNTHAIFANSIQSSVTGRIWICELRDTEMLCTVELSPEAADESVERMEEGMGVSAGIDKTKPFYVRVNGAAWSSVRILPVDDGQSDQGAASKAIHTYEAGIFGLAPRSTYMIEVIGIATGRVICSTSWITQPAQTMEQSAAVPVQPQHPSLRPSSPTTTLKQSIQSSEMKLAEIRAKAKKTKKDLKAANADIKKEITALKSKLDSSGGMDDKHRNRLAQIRQHKNQAEEAAEDIKSQIASFSEIPAQEAADAESKRKVWQAAKDAKAAALKDLANSKAAADQDLQLVKNELASSEAKREKLSARHAQRVKELDRARTEQEEKKMAMQKHEFERMHRMEQREMEEAQLRHHIAVMDAEAQNLQQKGMEAYSQNVALQNWTSSVSNFPNYSSPPTPENIYAAMPGSNNIPPQLQNGYSTYGPPNFYAVQQPRPNPTPRGRSSSMLSQYSGFTDEGDPYIYNAPPNTNSWPVFNNNHSQAAFHEAPERKQSDGSGSGGASGSGSGGGTDSTASSSPRPDAKPFIPNKMSPIGPPAFRK